MAGYRHQPKTYVLTFEDYPGLEITTKSISTGRLMKMMRMAVRLQDKDTSELTEEDTDAVDALFSGFAKALVGWNLLDDDDQPVPATRESVYEQEFDFILSIINDWISAVSGTPADLGKGSNSGPQFPEVSLPMDLLSPNRSS